EGEPAQAAADQRDVRERRHIPLREGEGRLGNNLQRQDRRLRHHRRGTTDPGEGMSRLIDISRPLAADTAGWPGDTPFSFRLAWRMADGASGNVGTVQTSVHTATHCDAPFHYDERGATVDRIPPETFLGPCWVVDVRGARRWGSRLEELEFTD